MSPQSQVLQLDIQGTPQAWITLEDAAALGCSAGALDGGAEGGQGGGFDAHRAIVAVRPAAAGWPGRAAAAATRRRMPRRPGGTRPRRDGRPTGLDDLPGLREFASVVLGRDRVPLSYQAA